MTDNKVHLVIQDKAIRKSVIRCLEALKVTFSEHEGRACITDMHDYLHERSVIPMLLLSDSAESESNCCVVLPVRISTLRKRIENFLTDYSI